MPLACWPHLLPADGCSRHWLSLPAHGATSLSSTIHLNFKFMLVAFYKKNKYRDIIVLLLTKGMHVLKIWKMQISIGTLKKKPTKKQRRNIIHNAVTWRSTVNTLVCVLSVSLALPTFPHDFKDRGGEGMCWLCEVQGCCLLILCGFGPLLLPLQLSISYLRLGRHLYQLQMIL